MSDGVARATIVILGKATDPEKFVAEDLRRVIEKMTSCTLPIRTNIERTDDMRIQVGRTQANVRLLESEDLMPEGFRIEVDDGNLYLVGKDDADTEFAVYTFLERYCNVGWFWPGELGEVIPKRRTIALDNVVDITDFSNHFLPSFAATGGGTYGPGQAIPEPSTVLLLGLGGLLLAYLCGCGTRRT